MTISTLPRTAGLKWRQRHAEDENAARGVSGAARNGIRPCWLIAEKEKQLPMLADVTGRKANAYVFCHEGITDERIDTLIDVFFIIHGAELSSLLRMKYSHFELNGSTHAPGVIEGANDADTLYRGYIMELMLRWTNTKMPLMFRDDVISLAGPYPFRAPGRTGASVNGSPARNKTPQPGTCWAFLRLLRECMSMLHENA